jgi:hypothetical protein
VVPVTEADVTASGKTVTGARPASEDRRWHIAQRGEHVFVLAGDWWSGTEEVRLEVKVQRRLNEQERATLKDWTSGVTRTVDSMFIVSPFTVDMEPCGLMNFLSFPDSGNIRLCTELLHKLGLSNGQFVGFFFHEFGQLF